MRLAGWAGAGPKEPGELLEEFGFAPTTGISELLKDVNPGSGAPKSLALEAPSSCQPGGQW